MAKKKCLICGGMYSYCSTCYEDRFKPAWYQIFCSEECKEIDGIIAGNTVGVISDIEAKHELEKLNLSGKVFHKQKVKDKIDYLLSLEEPKEEQKEEVIEGLKEEIVETIEDKEDNNKENNDKKNTNEILVESKTENGQDEEFKTKSSKRKYSKEWRSNNKNK